MVFERRPERTLPNMRNILGSALLLAAVAACDLNHVSEPSVVQPSDIDNPQGALARRAGAISAFANAFSNQAAISGLITDEFTEPGSLTDQRLVPVSGPNPSAGDGYPYPSLSQSRIDLLEAIHAMERFDPIPSAMIGELFAYAGYVDVLFGENMCSGVPLGSVVGETAVLGPTYSRSGLLRDALAQFDSASHYAGDSVLISDLIAVGKARALLDSGDADAAASTVGAVPTTFVYAPPYDGNVQYNFIYSAIVEALGMSVSDREGINGLPFISASDPRVPTQNVGPSAQNGSPVYNFTMYSSLSSPTVLASGIEARLIEAEHALSRGDIATWSSALNNLRSQAISPSMPTLSADSTTTADPLLRQDVMFRERAFWLFATGHRQGDLRRMIRYYGRSKDQVFPTGPYPGGGSYGEATDFVPFGEQYNPNFHGCLDIAP